LTAFLGKSTLARPWTRCAWQKHRELSAAGNLILKGSKYLWLKTHEDMRLKASQKLRALLVQDLQTGTA
jgi:hypothetical protein